MTHHKRSDDIINVQLGGARKDERRHPAASSIYEPTTRLIMAKTLTTEEFIARARQKHGDKYIYHKCEYVNAKTKVVITCREHGNFKQLPFNHLKGKGCMLCASKSKGLHNKKYIHDFIENASIIHGNRYDYSNTVYVAARFKIQITCHTHGVFEMTANNHLRGQGCPSCAKSGFNPDVAAYTYFLISEHGIKVGITNKISQRIGTLRRVTPFKFHKIRHVKMHGSHAAELERYYHRKYESAGLSGFDGATEWLKYSPELMSEIMNENPSA